MSSFNRPSCCAFQGWCRASVVLVVAAIAACSSARTGAALPDTGGGGSTAEVGGAPSGTSNQGGTTAGGSTSSSGAAPAAGGASRASGGSDVGTGGSAGMLGASAGSGGQLAGAAGSAGNSASAGCSESAPGYFIDDKGGSDANDGKTPATAWRSLTKANATPLKAGDRLCLRAGGIWNGQLKPQGSGSSAAPVVIDKYGSGDRPKIAAGSADKDSVVLENFAYVELNNLEVTNQKAAPGDYRGISVVGRDAGTLSHVQIRGCFVHDVTGEVNWIGGDVADNAPGVTFKTGWDASKRTGGIVFEIATAAAQPVKTLFNDVLIENNVIKDCSFAGIVFKQLDGSVHWGVRDSASDAQFSPHTKVVIRNNYINQHTAKLGCNGIYLTGTQGGTIEGNVIAEAGTSAIELYNTDSITVQSNETYGTIKKAGGADSNGIDTDRATTKSIIQYNYVHDNGDGILLCQFAFGDSVVRYNIIQNSSRYQLYLHSDSKATSAIYNNTFYEDKNNASLAYGYGDSLAAAYVLTNNLFVSTKTNAVLTTGGGIVYRNNLYFGSNVSAPTSDTLAIEKDPLLTAPGRGTNGSEAGPAFSSLSGYKLGAGSAALKAGSVMPNNGGKDFFGTALPASAPDIGAVQKP
ncbi:MAG TPA: right-handed parallel beta-helix repeat-containing protein [Polyangiaceae bacterium]|nr:right-handed parallel beta-helix repeat-containing protein [Polyangiaceae bacterium]